MACFKKDKFKKFGLLLAQLVAIAFLFVLIFQREAVIVIKELLDKFNIDAETQMFIARTWGAIKILINSPSFVGLFIVFVQIFSLAFAIVYFIMFVFYPSTEVEEKIKEKKYALVDYIECKNTSYLKNMRLLFWDWI